MKRPFFLPTKDYLCNHWINRIPFHNMRMTLYRKMGAKIGLNSTILMSTEVHIVRDISIGENTIINQHCHLDGRGGLNIGNNVNISSHVLLIAGSHDVQDSQFFGYADPITIEDYVWLCTRCTILAGVTIGRGAVVAAGAVVTKDVSPFTIVGGIPAYPIGERTHDLQYTLTYKNSWM